ncbi:hypothetical protein HPP92_012675 [Vanilla planifolia]|uniref:OCRE domain-containing protein n=1 Tax=Vanilla planifolia TaxID=51239 RepID=A0A835UZW6_VANPL|nr:hypothetical protein HPP92_012675 [Vanilla planifolia]
MKRRIAGILLPGETIVQALKRLKGKSNDKRAKMSESTKLLFDQLTEDAMKLMENGEYNVYHEERETFEREIASKDEDNYDIFGDDDDDNALDARMQSNDTTSGQTNHSPVRNLNALQNLDPTGDEDVQPEKATLDSSIDQTSKPTTGKLDPLKHFYYTDSTSGGSDSDYVYDPSSGYYYSSNLGYYYDPSSKLYCCATSGIWYSFDEQSGSYVEVGDASFQAL